MRRALSSADALSARASAASARAFHPGSTGASASEDDGADASGLRSIQRHHNAKQTTAATFSAVSSQPPSGPPAAAATSALASAAPAKGAKANAAQEAKAASALRTTARATLANAVLMPSRIAPRAARGKHNGRATDRGAQLGTRTVVGQPTR